MPYMELYVPIGWAMVVKHPNVLAGAITHALPNNAGYPQRHRVAVASHVHWKCFAGCRVALLAVLSDLIHLWNCLGYFRYWSFQHLLIHLLTLQQLAFQPTDPLNPMGDPMVIKNETGRYSPSYGDLDTNPLMLGGGSRAGGSGSRARWQCQGCGPWTGILADEKRLLAMGGDGRRTSGRLLRPRLWRGGLRLRR